SWLTLGSEMPGRRIAARSEDSFELCRAPSASALSQVDSIDSSLAIESQTALHESGASCHAPEVQLFSPTDSSPFFETACCPAGKEFCGGCAKMNAGKSACEVCSGGFTKTGSGKCVACVDLPGWVNKAGDNCLAAHCSAEKFQGFSSNSACCKCGGGQQAATKFAYFVGPIALGATQVVGHPVPRTASKYSVDKDCELAKFGLSIHPQTGALELAPGCSKVGCGSDKSIEVKCTITAEQEGGLTAQATLEVLAGDVGYGSEPVVLYSGDSTSVVPALNPEYAAGSGQFGALACVPGDASNWLELDAGTGKLSLKAGKQSAGGLTGGKGETMGQGSICSVEKGGAKGSVVVLSPSRWTGMGYSYSPSSDVLYATVGEKSPILQPNPEGDGLPPTRFSASCAGPAFAFDVLSGVATWDGHQIFTLDAEGGLQLSPEESLTQSLDSSQDGPVRRTVGPLQCTIFGHYEWSSARQGGIVSHRLTMEFRDHTCWAKTQQSFGSRIDKGHASESACRSKCRGELYCTHWAVDGGKCFFYSGLCKSSDVDDFACTLKHVWVTARYPGCGERHSCVDLKFPGHHYVSGKYCPGGENAASAAQGPVYFKRGLTTEDSFWLMRHESSRTGCSSGEWAIVKPKPEQDFENDTMAYVELHGDTVACVKGSSADLPSDIFGQPEVSLTVTRLGVSGAKATVAPPGCVTPNVTVVDGIEEDEGSVEALVLDDPATDVADDHWLHPCSCAPAGWGSLPPVSGETVTDIPAGSNNEFMSGAAVIVDGQFACEQEYLLEVIVETESDGLDPGNCRTRCLAQECPFFWEGEVMSTKQCRIYSQCTELVREVGAIGILYGMTYRKACKVADPALCWKATKRRSFLGAGDDSYACLYQDLVEQCDHKLMLGGLGISGCGHCEYAPVKGRLLYASNGGCADYAFGTDQRNVYVHACHGDDNQRWYFEGEVLKNERDNTCLDYHSENVYMHPCHGGSNQKWYFEHGFLKSRADGRCLDFHPGNNNMYVGNCPWSDTLLWNWKHNVHGGQQVASDYHHGTKCWTHDRSSNNVFVGDCTVAMKSRFFWDGERIKSETDSSLCLDASGDDRVWMYGCHSGNNQKWYFDGQLLKSRDDGRCIDFPFRVPTDDNLFRGNCPDSPLKRWHMGGAIPKPLPQAKIMSQHDYTCLDRAFASGDGNNIKMHPCHDGSNQFFYFDGEHLKDGRDGLCLDEPSSGSLYMHSCHGGDNQKWYLDNGRLKNRKWGDAKCMDYAYNNADKDVYMHECHSGSNQFFNFEVPRELKIRSDGSLCLDWNGNSDNVLMHPCHGGNNQLWYFHGPSLRSPHDSSKCLDMDENGNLYMHPCHGMANQHFTWDDNGRLKIHSDSGKCIDMNNDKNIYMHDCHSGDNQRFYWGQLFHKGKTIRNDEGACLDIISSTGKAQVYACHDGANQRFFFDGERLKVESDTDRCLDVPSRNVSSQLPRRSQPEVLLRWRASPNPGFCCLPRRQERRHGVLWQLSQFLFPEVALQDTAPQQRAAHSGRWPLFGRGPERWQRGGHWVWRGGAAHVVLQWGPPQERAQRQMRGCAYRHGKSFYAALPQRPPAAVLHGWWPYTQPPPEPLPGIQRPHRQCLHRHMPRSAEQPRMEV
ncbi:ath, partial [Symbiodinium sp. CCMP2592]